MCWVWRPRIRPFCCKAPILSWPSGSACSAAFPFQLRPASQHFRQRSGPDCTLDRSAGQPGLPGQHQQPMPAGTGHVFPHGAQGFRRRNPFRIRCLAGIFHSGNQVCGFRLTPCCSGFGPCLFFLTYRLQSGVKKLTQSEINRSMTTSNSQGSQQINYYYRNGMEYA